MAVSMVMLIRSSLFILLFESSVTLFFSNCFRNVAIFHIDVICEILFVTHQLMVYIV